MQNEIWKPLKNYEDLYEVSNFGNIKGLPKGHVLHHGSAFLSKEKNINEEDVKEAIKRARI